MVWYTPLKYSIQELFLLQQDFVRSIRFLKSHMLVAIQIQQSKHKLLRLVGYDYKLAIHILESCYELPYLGSAINF